MKFGINNLSIEDSKNILLQYGTDINNRILVYHPHVNIGFTGHRDCMAVDSDFAIIHRTIPNARWVYGGSICGFDRQVKHYIDLYNVEYTKHLPDYAAYPNKSAPLRRNDIIVADSIALVACWDKERTSGGTWYTLCRAYEKGIVIYFTSCRPDFSKP